jgi:hypothetical protein
MYIFKNGDACPCCGRELIGMSDEALRLFSQLCHVAGIEAPDNLNLEIQDIDTTLIPPPDAGINPPVRPVSKI